MVALLAASVSFAAEPAPPEPSVTTGPTVDVLNALHHQNLLHIELGQLTRSNTTSPKVKAWGERLIRQHQKLDRDLFAYAKENQLTVSETGWTAEKNGAAQPVSRSDAAPASATAARGNGDALAAINDEQTVRKTDREVELEGLRAARGSRFDRQFFTMIRSNTDRVIPRVELAKDKSADVGLDRVLDTALQTWRDHEVQLERLDAATPVS